MGNSQFQYMSVHGSTEPVLSKVEGLTTNGLKQGCLRHRRGARRYAMASLRKACRETHRLLQRTGTRPTLAHDVEGRAVCRCGEYGLQPAGYRHAAIEALQLGRDLALIVIHAEHA